MKIAKTSHAGRQKCPKSPKMVENAGGIFGFNIHRVCAQLGLSTFIRGGYPIAGHSFGGTGSILSRKTIQPVLPPFPWDQGGGPLGASPTGLILKVDNCSISVNPVPHRSHVHEEDHICPATFLSPGASLKPTSTVLSSSQETVASLKALVASLKGEVKVLPACRMHTPRRHAVGYGIVPNVPVGVLYKGSRQEISKNCFRLVTLGGGPPSPLGGLLSGEGPTAGVGVIFRVRFSVFCTGDRGNLRGQVQQLFFKKKPL